MHSVNWLNRSIWLTIGTLPDTMTPSPSGPGCYGNVVILHIPQSLRLEVHYQMQFTIISRTPVAEGLIPLQRCNRCNYSTSRHDGRLLGSRFWSIIESYVIFGKLAKIMLRLKLFSFLLLINTSCYQVGWLVVFMAYQPL